MAVETTSLSENGLIPPFPLWLSSENYAQEIGFKFFYGPPGSGKHRGILNLLNFYRWEHRFYYLSVNQKNQGSRLDQIQKIIESHFSIPEGKLFESSEILPGRVSPFPVIFIPNELNSEFKKMESLEIWNLLEKRLKKNRVWVIGPTSPGISSAWNFFYYPPLGEKGCLPPPFLERDLHRLKDWFLNFTQGLELEEVNLLTTFISRYFPMEVGALKPNFPLGVLNSLSLKGYLRISQGKIFIHPFFKNPWLRVAIKIPTDSPPQNLFDPDQITPFPFNFKGKKKFKSPFTQDQSRVLNFIQQCDPLLREWLDGQGHFAELIFPMRGENPLTLEEKCLEKELKQGQLKSARHYFKKSAGAGDPLIKGDYFLLTSKVRSAQILFTQTWHKALSEGNIPMALKGGLGCIRCFLYQGSLKMAKKFIHHLRRLQDHPPGFDAGPELEILQGRFHLLNASILESPARNKQLSHAITCAKEALKDLKGTELNEWHVQTHILIGDIYQATGEWNWSADQYRKGGRISKKTGLAYFYFLSRLKHFELTGQKIDGVLPESYLHQLEKIEKKIPSGLGPQLGVKIDLLKAQFYKGRKYWAKGALYLDKILMKNRVGSFGIEKLNLLEERLFMAHSLGIDVEIHEKSLQHFLKNAPKDLPLYWRGNGKGWQGYRLKGKIKFFPEGEKSFLLEKGTHQPIIDLETKTIFFQGDKIDFSRNHKIGKYLEFFCRSRNLQSTHQDIFEAVEGEDYYPEEDGNKLRQYIRRVRKLLDFKKGMGELVLQGTGDGGYSFDVDRVLIIFPPGRLTK